MSLYFVGIEVRSSQQRNRSSYGCYCGCLFEAVDVDGGKFYVIR